MSAPEGTVALSATNPFLPEIPRRPHRGRTAVRDPGAGLDADRDGLRHGACHQAPDPAVGLNDSPAGLAAWITERFRAWSDCGGEVERAFGRDGLLTNLTVYWPTQTIGSSIRLY